MPNSSAAIKGDPTTCRNCDQLHDEHIGILNMCPGKTSYRSFERKYNHDGSLDTELQAELLCPWCGKAQTDLWDMPGVYENDNHSEWDCQYCEEPFESECFTSHRFTTHRPEKDGGE